MSVKSELEKSVASAFEAASHGDLGPSSNLAAQAGEVAPLLKPYLDEDASETVRLQAVALLKVAGNRAAAPLLAKALRDHSADVRENAAEALFDRYDPYELAKNQPVGDALAESVRAGNHSAAALLLLGYFPGTASQAALHAAAKSGNSTKLHPWSPVTSTALPADVSLSRLGDASARTEMLEAIEAGKLEDLEFLLNVLREIDSPKVIHALTKTLGDTRPILGGVPAGASPARRLCDLAVDALVRRLDLKPGFPLDEAKRYGEAERQAVGQAIDNSLPQ